MKLLYSKRCFINTHSVRRNSWVCTDIQYLAVGTMPFCFKCASKVQFILHIKVKFRVPWRRIEGAELYLHCLLISALDGSECSASRPVGFTHRKITRNPTGQEAVWSPQHVWMIWRKTESLTYTRIGTLDRPAGRVNIPNIIYKVYIMYCIFI